MSFVLRWAQRVALPWGFLTRAVRVGTPAFLLVALAAPPSQAGQIGVGDFEAGAQTTTFDDLGLPLFPNFTPFVIDGHTINTDDGVFRYFNGPLIACASNDCLANNSDLGFFDIVLSEPSLQAGAFATSLDAGWRVQVDFFDPGDALLGTVILSNPGGPAPTFAGWEDPGGIARIRIQDQTPNGRIMWMDELTVFVPEPSTGLLVALGLAGLGARSRRR
ncbi:MAG: PEP-CTERM sorting domain-containing protein [Myxococcota bacterium]|nr:PEP-CTERM sorting domain-containing protein [Myxococcota bacterium]